MNKNISLKTITNAVLYSLLLFFIYLIILITIQYIPINYDIAFLSIKQEQIQYTHYKIAFFIHVYTSIFVLITGSTQFSNYIRLHHKKLHHIFGKIYIAIILLFAAPSGLLMGFYANGNLISKFSFCLLAILWFHFTLYAYIEVKKQNYLQHQKFMIRSYALTLSAISLRLFKYIIVNLFHTAPMDTYILVSWLGWTFNLIIAEIIIGKMLSSKSKQ